MNLRMDEPFENITVRCAILSGCPDGLSHLQMPRIAERKGGFLRFVCSDQEFGIVAENKLCPFIPRNTQRSAISRQAEPYSPAAVFEQRAVFPDKDLFDILPGIFPEIYAQREKAHVNTVFPDLRVQAQGAEKKGDQENHDDRDQ